MVSDFSFLLGLQMGVDFVSSRSGFALGSDVAPLNGLKSMAYGLTSPDLPQVAGVSTGRIINSISVGYVMIALLAVSFLVYFIFSLRYKREGITNGNIS